MKKILLTLLISICLAACSKNDDQKNITNLTGSTWYNTQVWFRNIEGGELSGYEDVGTVSVGGNCVVSSDKPRSEERRVGKEC